VHYRDLEFLDDETAYFKRYYGTTETSTRIKKLISKCRSTARLLRDQHDRPIAQPASHSQLPHPRNAHPKIAETVHNAREIDGQAQHCSLGTG
jgi:hypothetical protein